MFTSALHGHQVCFHHLKLSIEALLPIITMKRGRSRKIILTDYSAKPREERDYTDYYANLDPTKPLAVRIVNNDKTESNSDDSLLTHLQSDPGFIQYASRLKHRLQMLMARLRQISGGKLEVSHEDALSDQPDVDRRYLKLGYHDERSIREGRRSEEGYSRQNDWSYGLVRGRLRYNNRFKVLYDMDEQDGLFVDYINQIRSNSGLGKLSYEVFEACMTFLEMQFFYIDQVIPPQVKNQEEITQQQKLWASMYGSDDGTGISSEEDQACAVCGKSECDASNAIVFCDGCNIAVHQECYGIPFIPEGGWLCRRCLISRDQGQKCVFCPSTTGAFKQTDNGHWAHVICALWIGELYFANPTYMEPIEGAESIPRSRWRLTCYICKQHVGACIQCCNPNCFKAYHVTCARRAQLYMAMQGGIKGAIDEPTTLVSYCGRHTPKEWAETHDIWLGVEQTRLYYSRGTPQQLQRQRSSSIVSPKEKTALDETKSWAFDWKTEGNAPIVPEVVRGRLLNFVQTENIGVEQMNELSKLICKYWTLKRERSKLPLIRRPDPIDYTLLNEEEIDERLADLDMVYNDVEKLTDFSKAIIRRCQTVELANESLINETGLFYSPAMYGVLKLGWSFLKCDKSHTLSTIIKVPDNVINGADIVDKIENCRYRKVQDLIDDIKQLTSYVAAHYGRTTSAYRLLRVTWGKSSKKKYVEALTLERMAANGELDEIYKEFDRNGLTIKPVEPISRRLRH